MLDLYRGLRGMTLPWARCPECGRRRHFCGAFRRTGGYRGAFRHWWNTRDMSYRGHYRDGRPTWFDSRWDAKRKVAVLDQLMQDRRRPVRSWARRHLSSGRLP